ncbi:MAG TPA: DUF2911 domain-containing protein [Terriglobales bacterium]
MKSQKLPLLVLVLFPAAVPAFAELTLPPSGDNQRATVTQQIGPVVVSVEYSSPRVTLKGDNRRGKIWGQLVPYGLTKLAPDCPQCPWRAGANENTIFTASRDVKVQGQTLPAGKYGLHMMPGKEQFTVIFSKNSTAWGSYSYDAKEDALRVTTKPVKADYHEWLTYEFIEREPAKATVALVWEDLQIPLTISVDNAPALYCAAMHDDLRGSTGFDWHNVQRAADYCVRNKVNLQEAMTWANRASTPSLGGDENVATLMSLSRAQAANGQSAEASKTFERALASPAAKPIDFHVAGRALLAEGKNEQAMKIFQINAKRFPNQWPVHVGLMRGYAATGDKAKALEEGRLAVKQAPDDGNRLNLENALKAIEAGRKID